jgi:hypothetical protein
MPEYGAKATHPVVAAWKMETKGTKGSLRECLPTGTLDLLTPKQLLKRPSESL